MTNLIIDEWSTNHVRLVWHFPDEGDYDTGGHLGEGIHDEGSPPPKVVKGNPESLEAWETWAATHIAIELGAERDSQGFYWDTTAAARKVLAAINKRIKAGPEAEPDVMITAETARAALLWLQGERVEGSKAKTAIKELKQALGRKK